MSDENVVILDVRTMAEFQSGHVQSARNIDFYSPAFQDEILKLDRNRKYHLYCRSGNRSGQAEMIMKQLGFKEVQNIGGLEEAAQMYSFEPAD